MDCNPDVENFLRFTELGLVKPLQLSITACAQNFERVLRWIPKANTDKI